MKLFCLSGHPNKPCHVLRFKHCTIMLDCGLDETSVLNFLPVPLVPSSRLLNLPHWTPKEKAQVKGELKECASKVFVDSSPEFCTPQTSLLDLSTVDIILISNYTSMLALPYIVTECGFDGVVYATVPTIQIGKLCMEELVTFVEKSPSAKRATRWKQIVHLLPHPLNQVYKPNLWRCLYSHEDIAKALTKVEPAGYGEKIDVFGSLKVMPCSSGYCLGSANWVITSDHEKIVYVSGSTTLTTHPKQLEQSQLRSADVLILNSLTQVPSYNPDSMIGEFCAKAAHTLKASGNVLVPCAPSGIVYDLLECLAPYLEQQGLGSVPLYFVSPVARHSLAYSNILAEWLSPAKQQRVYLPDDPFPHGQLVAGGRLRPYATLYADGFSSEFRQPCVVFCGHPSLRCGDAVHFMELWRDAANNAVIFTSPDFPYLECLAPYQPLSMKFYFTPIDTSLFYNQANKLIRDLKPRTLVLPHRYTNSQSGTSTTAVADINVEAPAGCQLMTFLRGDVLDLPVRRKHERVLINSSLATTLIVSDVGTGVYSAATLTGRLCVRDNKHWLCQLNELPSSAGRLQKLLATRPRHHPYGSFNVHQLVTRLSQRGISDAKVEDTAKGVIVHLPSKDVLIQLEANSTHIIGDTDENTRRAIRDALLQCLSKF